MQSGSTATWTPNTHPIPDIDVIYPLSDTGYACSDTHTHTHAYKLRHINTLATVQCIVLKLLPDHPLIEDQSKHVTTDVKLSIGRLKWTETEITLYSSKAWLIIEFNRQFKLIQDNKIRI